VAFDTFRREFDGLYRRGRLFNFMLHPQLVRASHLDHLEKLLQRALATDDTWVTTASKVAAHWRERTG
jgi:hypothetical protein